MTEPISNETRRKLHNAIDSFSFDITHRGYGFAERLLMGDWYSLQSWLKPIVAKWGGNTFGMHLDIEALPRLPY